MEEILLNISSGSTTGYTVSYVFNEHLNRLAEVKNVPAGVEYIPSYITFNELNQPLGIFTFDGKNLYGRNNRNNFAPLDEITNNFITGYTQISSKNVILSDEKKSERERILKNDIAFSLSGIGINTSNTFVFFEEEQDQDVFVKVGLVRNFEHLDTLNVYNRLTNSTPIQNANSGVAFGKLEAIQVVKDTNGNNLRIPLSNVPVGIFNPSEDFPTSASVDQDGNRIKLNYQSNPVIEDFLQTEYFNSQSLEFDNSFLPSSEEFDSIPDQYQFMTKTNENGEFILYNLPIGSQTLIFEVDLLKQGLTKEEVALNRFDYPGSTENPNIGDVPHFFFREIPIEIFPAWGEFQTGYTELNISVNLDLRKWSTYYFPPVSFGGKTLGELQLEDGIFTPLKMSVRDMTKEDFAGITIEDLAPTPMVEIADPIQRTADQELEWRNEFAQLKGFAEFRRHDYSIIKLPSNIYDPNIINSREQSKVDADPSYSPRTGTWFSGYQFKFEFFSNGFFRTTGLERKVGDVDGAEIVATRDHFHLNRNITGDNIEESNVNTFAEGFNQNIFPYERPWNHLYPDQVKIPAVPSSQNPDWIPANLGGQRNIPKYLDGDLVGNVDNTINDSGGYALQIKTDEPPERSFENRFSKRLTRDLIYKYEKGVFEGERYASGYQPSLDSNQTSTVFSGERYQRVECGFGYFLRPEGWPDIIFDEKRDYINKELTYNFPDNLNSVNLQSNLDITMKTDADVPALEGGVDIYKIIDPSPGNLIDPDGNIIPTFVELNTQRVYRKRTDTPNERLKPAWAGRNNGGNQDEGKDSATFIFPHFPSSRQFVFSSFKISITNNGTKKIEDPFTPSLRLAPGQTSETEVAFQDDLIIGNVEFDFDIQEDASRLKNIKLKLEGNDDFDTSELKFRKSKYTLKFFDYNDGAKANGPAFRQVYDVNIDLDAKEDPDSWYMVQKVDNVASTITTGNRRRCKDCFKSNRDVEFDGVVLAAGDGKSSHRYLRWVDAGGRVGNGECDSFGKSLCNNLRLIPWRFA